MTPFNSFREILVVGWQSLSRSMTFFSSATLQKLTRISPVLIHCNYLVNLASADEFFLAKSRESFREEVERALVLGVDYLVVHPGSARGSCEADGIALCAQSLKIACKGLRLGSLKILLENTAGQGECIGHRFEHLKRDYGCMPKTTARSLFRYGACVHGRLRHSRRRWTRSVDSENAANRGTQECSCDSLQ